MVGQDQLLRILARMLDPEEFPAAVPAPNAINPASTTFGRVQRSPIAAPSTRGIAVPSP